MKAPFRITSNLPQNEPALRRRFRRTPRVGAALLALGLLSTPMPAQVVEKWAQRYNGPGNSNDYAARIVVDSAGHVAVTGASITSGTNFDYYTASYAAADGSLLWEKRYNGPANGYDSATCLAVDAAGNVVAGGFSHNSANADFYTAKYAAADGALLWERRYNGPANNTDEARAIVTDSAGNVIVTGVSSNGANADCYTAKYAAADGALLWERRYNGPANGGDEARSIAVDSVGNVVVTGLSSNGPNNDYYTAKYAAADGALLWEKRYNGPANSTDEARAIAVDGMGNVTVTGSSSNGATPDYYTARYAAADGTLLWEKRYNGPANNYDDASSLAVDGAGNASVSGLSIGTSASFDYYTASYAAADGALRWEQRYNGPASGNDYVTGLAADNAGNVFVTGVSSGNGTGNDYHTIKYGPVPDTTPPALSTVTIASSNTNMAWARVGDTVTVSFTANEPIQPPMVTLLGVTATVTNPGGNNWTASAPVGATTAQGSAAFSITATDLLGNTASAVLATTNGSLVKVDKTAPTLSLPANMTVAAMGASGAVVTFIASATDNLDPAPEVIVVPASGSPFPIGTTRVTGFALDAAGNISGGNFTVTVQDRTNAPVFTNAGTVPLTSNGFTATGLTVGAVTLDFDPADGLVLTLVNNTSTNPIGGAFTDLAEGGTVLTTFGGRSLLFVASYTGGDGNDVTLTLLAPEIAVASGADLPDGGSKSFATMVFGQTSLLNFAIRNTGPGILNGLTLTKSGANQADFTVSSISASPLSGPAGTRSFSVLFNPAGAGARTVTLHLASDDADENPYDITLTGRALSASDDTDGDGLNDAAELLLAALGYDWQSSQPPLVGTLAANAGLFTQAQMDANRQAGRDEVLAAPNTFSLYTLSQIQALHLGAPLLTKNPQTGKFTLTIGIKKSADLLQYSPFPFTDPGTTINGQGRVEFEFTAPGNVQFFRLEAQ